MAKYNRDINEESWYATPIVWSLLVISSLIFWTSHNVYYNIVSLITILLCLSALWAIYKQKEELNKKEDKDGE